MGKKGLRAKASKGLLYATSLPNASLHNLNPLFSPLKLKTGYKMKLKADTNWVEDRLFRSANPHPFEVTAVEMRDVQGGKKDLVLFMRSMIDSEIYGISIWKKNKNTMINRFGDDTDAWIGKRISISQITDPNDGKKLKEVQ